MKISNENNLKRSVENSKSRFNWSQLKFWESEFDWSRLKFWNNTNSDVYENETFTSKREKAARKRKHRLVMIGVLCLVVGGSVTSAVIPLLRNMRVAAEKKVPVSNLTDSSNDAAAKAILRGDAVKVKDDAQKNKKIKKAVAAQADADNEKLNKLNDQVTQLTNELNTLKDDATSLKNQVDELSKANKELTDSNQSLSDENAKLKSDTSTKESDYQKQIDDYQKQIADLQAQLKDAQDNKDAQDKTEGAEDTKTE